MTIRSGEKFPVFSPPPGNRAATKGCFSEKRQQAIIEKNEGGTLMKTMDILKKLREEKGLTQDQLAERVMVTRQAVSRWGRTA